MTELLGTGHEQATGAPAQSPDLDVLRSVEQRVLWLANAIIHHANAIRPNPSGVKVGGHPASSASITSIMTALWFGSLDPDDRVSVKPHASPVLHAINYLLGDLDQPYLETLRAFGGLQAYPSRTKDPDSVDYSTASVGLGATAPIWGAFARRYLDSHFGSGTAGRQISLLGDAELDEGACWEAILDPAVAQLGQVLWVVDLNRQSLDRVVPMIAAGRLAQMFDAAGWQVLTLKYGRRLRELFARPGGDALRARIDEMTNPEYQRLLRADAQELRVRLPGHGRLRAPLEQLVADVDDRELRAAVRDLGGHDLADLLEAFHAVDGDRPSVILAYTIKGYDLPIEGHPRNHSAMLTGDQYRQLASTLGADADQPWRPLPADSREGELCRRTAARLQRPDLKSVELPLPPASLKRQHTGKNSTQSALGRLLLDLTRDRPEFAERIVTVSPDVATSTNLGGWLNKVGVWSTTELVDWFADDAGSPMRWREHPRGQHIELGIAETNMVGLLGELGATWSQCGQPLVPIGTMYDPFVCRALEPWSYGMYAGGQSILVGTPSGVTLAPEGGAHQSVTTPSIGLEQPGVVAYEPAFTQDFEWCFLDALSRIGRPAGESAYFRLSTRVLEQSTAEVPEDGDARERRRRQTLAGGYRLRDADLPQVTIVVMGAVVAEAIAAVSELAEGGLPARLVCVTSADLLFRALHARGGPGGDGGVLDELFPPSQPTPLVTVLDGHPHTLTFLGAVRAVPVTSLGVTQFGQSGDLADVYRHHGIDAAAIVEAAWELARQPPRA